ncbi:type II toxin-antitoxin system PemK/MazF family toxin [Candidatus Saccharibacteria bacterium]|nr:type II toxin-antitoxin system PemK/MazF family toxin [Candidatus Saccharibacteria bacterium]
MEIKHFKQWIDLKSRLHFGASSPKISEGDIWWCGCGENVGVEINGKSSRFSRPVLIMKKLSSQGFMGIPLTSQKKTGSWYAKFVFLDKEQFAAVCQARVMSSSRLYSKIGQIPLSDLSIVKRAFIDLYK